MASQHEIIIDVNLSEEQAAVRETTRQYATLELKPQAADIDRKQEIPEQVWRRLSELQLLGTAVPAAYGGLGLSTLSAITVIEELARVCASTALAVAAHAGLCASPLVRFGSETQKQHFLPPLALGNAIGAFGLTESSAGSDAANAKTVATQKGDRFVVSGSKIFITNAPVASTFLVAVSTNAKAGAQGITALVIEAGTPGFKVIQGSEKLGMRGSSWGRTFVRRDGSSDGQYGRAAG